MKNESEAYWYTREMLSVIAPGVLIFANWWLAMDGAAFGENLDTVRRVVGVLTGVYIILDGNRTPRMALTPPSQHGAAVVQRFVRFTGWTWVLTGMLCVLSWLLLSIDLAFLVSILVCLFASVMFSGYMFAVARRLPRMKGEGL